MSAKILAIIGVSFVCFFLNGLWWGLKLNDANRELTTNFDTCMNDLNTSRKNFAIASANFQGMKTTFEACMYRLEKRAACSYTK